MAPGNSITGGAICDLWYEDSGAIIAAEPAKIASAPWVTIGTCETCSYFMAPDVCILTGKKASKKCGKYELSAPVIVPSTLDNNCTVCMHAMYKDDKPWCRIKDSEIAADEWCERFILDGGI
jgi:hypothetical protein